MGPWAGPGVGEVATGGPRVGLSGGAWVDGEVIGLANVGVRDGIVGVGVGRDTGVGSGVGVGGAVGPGTGEGGGGGGVTGPEGPH